MELKPRRVAIMLDLEVPLQWHTEIFSGTQRYARQQGWESTIDEVIGDTLPQRRTKSPPYDGIIGRVPKPLAGRAIGLGLPTVNVWFSSPAKDLLPGVFPDYVAAGRQRAEHLLARGFRNFAVITSRSNRKDDVEGEEFRRVVEAAGFRRAIQTVALDSLDSRNWRDTHESITRFMGHWQLPIGLFVGNDSVGRLVAQLCSKQSWRVPQDVAIITGGNIDAICENPPPSLTSLEYGYERIGYEAARLLDRLMDEQEKVRRTSRAKQKGRKQKGKMEKKTPEHILMPPIGLVVRESTDFFAVDDELVGAALEFISANSHRPIGVNDVARAVVAEPRTLQLRFRKVLDRPIAKEICRVRIERAKRELAQSDRSLSEIAKSAGFASGDRLYVVFQREEGISPSDYRKQRQVAAEV